MISFDPAVIRDMVEQHPEAFRAGPGKSPDCPDCGLPMLGSKTDDGPFCVRSHSSDNSP